MYSFVFMFVVFLRNVFVMDVPYATHVFYRTRVVHAMSLMYVMHVIYLL